MEISKDWWVCHNPMIVLNFPWKIIDFGRTLKHVFQKIILKWRERESWLGTWERWIMGEWERETVGQLKP